MSSVKCILKCCFSSFSEQTDCKVCPAGYYCTSGTDSPVACPAGTYNPSINQGSVDDCRSCKSGMACPQIGLTRPTEMCSAGHFCPAGSAQPNETFNACPAGTYTNYHNLTADTQCDNCPAGKACLKGTGGNQKPPEACAPGKKLSLFATHVLSKSGCLTCHFHHFVFHWDLPSTVLRNFYKHFNF